MPVIDPNRFFESFLRPGERSRATHELASHGADAVPVLESLFNGAARNTWGHPYAGDGVAVDCGFVTARLLGPLARPLQPFLREGLRRGHVYAAEAFGFLGVLDEESVVELTRCVAALDGPSGSWLVACEAAAALVRCGALDHPVVREVADGSGRAAACLRGTVESIRRQGPR